MKSAKITRLFGIIEDKADCRFPSIAYRLSRGRKHLGHVKGMFEVNEYLASAFGLSLTGSAAAVQ
jgi:hypothetical protein